MCIYLRTPRSIHTFLSTFSSNLICTYGSLHPQAISCIMTKQQHRPRSSFPYSNRASRAHAQALEAQSNLPQDVTSQTRSMILEISAVAGPIISIPTPEKMWLHPQASHPMSVCLQMTRWGWVSIGFYRSMFLSKANPLSFHYLPE